MPLSIERYFVKLAKGSPLMKEVEVPTNEVPEKEYHLRRVIVMTEIWSGRVKEIAYVPKNTLEISDLIFYSREHIMQVKHIE